jgi:hypothetical protein
VTLGDYITEVRRILHDATRTYWTDADLTSFINRAMKQRDRDTGMHRAQSFSDTVIGVNHYSLDSLTPVYPDGTFAAGTVFDVMGLILVWGNLRQQLAHVPYTDLSSFYQPLTSYQNIPLVYCLYGAKFLLLAPAPQQVYPMVLDCVMVSPDLANSVDEDPLPDPWTDPVPFAAAAFAKEELGQSDESDRYFKIYQQRVMSVSGSRIRMLSQPYTGISG